MKFDVHKGKASSRLYTLEKNSVRMRQRDIDREKENQRRGWGGIYDSSGFICWSAWEKRIERERERCLFGFTFIWRVRNVD